MYEIIENVIKSKNFELGDILKKIETMWLQSYITEEQKTQLIELARENALPENTYAPLEQRIEEVYGLYQSLNSKCDSMALVIQEIKKSIENLGGTVTEPEEPEEPTNEYPEYKQPTGAHDAYYNGDKVTFNGEHYTCIAPEGSPCVWSPSEYPMYWQKEA